MKQIITAVAVIALGAAAAGCDKPRTNTSYNNSGSSAATAPSATPTTTIAPTDSATPSTTTMAPGPSGNATGAVSETITTGKIKAAIAADNSLKDSEIMVSTNNGVVMLTGTVKSQDQVAIATQLAQRQEGVTKVETTVTVR